MTQKPPPTDAEKLRAEAEARARLSTHRTPQCQHEKLVHELRVHQIELEMQNEELRGTQLALEASRDGYLSLYDFAPIGYVTLNREGMVAEINLTATSLLGEERTRLLNRRFSRFLAPEDGDRWHRHFTRLLQHGERQRIELGLNLRDGRHIDGQLDCLRVMADETTPTVRIALSDITERRREQAELRLAATAFETREAMIITDEAKRVEQVNRAFTKLTGYAASEVVGRTPFVFDAGLQERSLRDGIWQEVDHCGSWQGEVLDRRSGGEVYSAWLTITAVPGPEGGIANYVATLADLTERKAAENEIKQLAFYDPLTKLPNRRLLLERLKQALSASVLSMQHGALVFIDLDNFKSLNDTRGHDSGDLLLQQVALRLTQSLRENETVARLGGDEFVVLLENLGSDQDEAAVKAELVGEKILAALDEPYRLAGDEYFGTPSIGVALFGSGDDSIGELLKEADLAMYQAKAAGRDTVRVFRPEMRTAAAKLAALERDMRAGLEEGKQEFVLHYQPQVDRERRLMGVEALLRWQHPRHGLLQPGEFVAIAEQTGLILPLGNWVLQAACEQIKAWAATPATERLTVSVNVSVRQLRHPQFVDHVLAAIGKAGIDARRLKLELTESMLLENLEDTIAKMTALKARDVRFSLDDFGTGYSSLSYLKRLLLYQVKIDRSFVAGMLTDPGVAAITRAVVALGRSLGLSVTAEGVESETQWAVLSDMGCNLFQGYLFGRPMPVTTLRLPVKAVW